MPEPVTVSKARERAAKLVARDRRQWITTESDGAGSILDVPLHPPSERRVQADPRAAADWAASWRGITGDDVEVRWVQRDWPSAGRQQVPDRLTLSGAEAIARFAGRDALRDWVRLRDRARMLRHRFQNSEPLGATMRRHAKAIEHQSDSDFALLLEVIAWLRDSPASGYRLRQIPIPGMHTKWLGERRSLVEAIHTAVTGRPSLGLIEAPETVRVRFLDPLLRPGGLTDVSAPIEEIAALPIAPRTVFVCENLESVLALPDWPGAVAIHGAGYAVPVHGMPWARSARILYWGDLDADGFAILHRLRSQGIAARSILMDEETLLEHRTLWVPDPAGAARRLLTTLTASEQRALDRIAVEGGVRLEQERLPWPQVLDALRAADA